MISEKLPELLISLELAATWEDPLFLALIGDSRGG